MILCAIGVPLRLGADERRSLAGELLVATPEMRDPRFKQTVIYMVKHDGEGAMGLVINRPIAKGPIEDLLKNFGVESKGAKGEIILYYGGPVEAKRSFILHSNDYLLDSSTAVKDGLAVTADVDMLRAMSLGKGPSQSLFALGYAGWAPGQLEAEIRAGSWFTIEAEKNLIFGPGYDKKWRQAMDKRKIPL